MSTGAVDTGRRTDAQRNRRTLLDVACDVLAADPNAAMSAVAAAAGLHRATLYRHFPDREALLREIRSAAWDDGVAAVARARLDENGVREALARLIAEVINVGASYRVLAVIADGPEITAARRRAIRGPLVALMVRGQAEGVLRDDLEPDWLVSHLRTLLLTALVDVESGRSSPTRAAAVTLSVLLDGLRPTP